MAFIELNENELAMLSEEEREQYTVRLKLHRERVEFVKKLEQIEKQTINIKSLNSRELILFAELIYQSIRK